MSLNNVADITEETSYSPGSVNIMFQRTEEIFCQSCFTNIGWTYVRAYEPSQQYKVGKFILERAYIEQIRNKKYNPSKRNKSKSKKNTESATERTCAGGVEQGEGVETIPRVSSAETMTDTECAG